MKWRAWGKWALPGIAAMLAVVAYFPGSGHDAAVVPARTAKLPPVRSQAQDGHVDLDRLNRQKTAAGKEGAAADAFNPTSWYVPPPPPPPQPPPPPTAPPLPFTYLGRYQDGASLVVMLAKGDRLYTVSEGEVIDATYRVERITDQAVDFVYLPMNIDQSISTIVAVEDTTHHAAAGASYRRP